jgi:hypothetical protein
MVVRKYVTNGDGVDVPAGLAVLKWVIRWEKVKVGYAHACLSCISWMRSRRGFS